MQHDYPYFAFMNNIIDNIRSTRTSLLGTIADLSAEQLNETPAGFNNNIIWNLGHMVAAQQGVCYMRGGAPIIVEEKYWINYKPGSKPGEFVGAEEIQKIKDLMVSTLDRLTTDVGTNIFDNYTSWTTRYGVNLADVNDAIHFLSFHEGLHTGVIMSLMKLVKKD
jgi:hypothetical protein